MQISNFHTFWHVAFYACVPSSSAINDERKTQEIWLVYPRHKPSAGRVCVTYFSWVTKKNKAFFLGIQLRNPRKIYPRPLVTWPMFAEFLWALLAQTFAESDLVSGHVCALAATNLHKEQIDSIGIRKYRFESQSVVQALSLPVLWRQLIWLLVAKIMVAVLLQVALFLPNNKIELSIQFSFSFSVYT